MGKKIVGSLICGVYISIGATAFIALENPVAGAFFFTAGILMVSAFYGMLVTRVIALFPYKEYGISDVVLSLLGNTVGCVIYAASLGLTRFGNDANVAKLERIVGLRLSDGYVSLFILAVLCGFLVACACLSAKVFPDNKTVSMFLTVMFIAVFVVCGFEHIVADSFFFAYYSVVKGFEMKFVAAFAVVAAGNIAGGMSAGYLERFRNGEK
ncbi:MAG: formate/nitrite transporter family protein [Oscillospiraceae bacterium]|jgi:formate/nitrite transporter FocA (FNT family)|nr:formate/nitrite transporter family protein [Oscillospiraceae bacterium]